MICELKVVYNALELRDLLDKYSPNEMQTMNIIGDRLMVQINDEILTDGSSVKNIYLSPGPAA